MNDVSQKSELDARKRTFEFPAEWKLTGQEMRMLGCLMVVGNASHRDVHLAISRRDDTIGSVVRVISSTLRTKLRRLNAPVTIETARGYGYNLVSAKDFKKWLDAYDGPKVAVQLHRGPKAYLPPVVRKRLAEQEGAQ